MNTIMTYTKRRMDPLAPRPEDLDIRDIAHALSMTCRAGGHFQTFYSVAQHSINCAREASQRGYSRKVQLGCLLHDGSEAYISDITRPVKVRLDGYLDFEAAIQELIWSKWLSEPLTSDERAQVFAVDDAMLCHEFLGLMGEQLVTPSPALSCEPALGEAPIVETERSFLKEFKRLTTEAGIHRAVGVDWCGGRWLAVRLAGDDLSIEFYRSIAELCSANNDADMLLIDVPIGLPESRAESELRPDSEARKLLGVRRSSVFNVLFRQVVYADTAKEAWKLNEELDARMQMLGLGLQKATRQADEFLREHTQWKNRLTESHPELGFLALNGGAPMLHNKKTLEGETERLDALKRGGLDTERMRTLFRSIGGKRTEMNDLIDAACLALNASLGAERGYRYIPANPALDSQGLKMQMAVADF